MSILFVLLMFLLILTVNYFRTRETEVVARPQPAIGPMASPKMEHSLGMSIPQGYSFHPGHTWVMREGLDSARIGIDSFATNLIGKIDRVDVVGENRWIRQGQKVATVRSGDIAIDLVSPVEGVIVGLNRDVMEEPAVVGRDPYEKGWIATLKSPDLAINQKNLMQGGMVAPWLQNSVTRLNGMVAELAPTMAADGGVPLAGLIGRLEPEMRQKVVKEFFLV